MAQRKYTREFRFIVAREAVKPEYENLEHVIAKKYGIRPWTVQRWKEHYLEYGEDSFKKGSICKKDVKSPRELELEKRNAELEEEVKILKKAAAFLANVGHE